MSIKSFCIKTLNAGGLGIVIPLIPYAILGSLLKPLAANSDIIATFLQYCQNIQGVAPILIGFLVATFVGLNPLRAGVVSFISFLSAGNLTLVQLFTAEGIATNVLRLQGLGDLVNAIFMAGLSSAIILKMNNIFRSLEIICLPIVGVIFAYIGRDFSLPIVSNITTWIADAVEYFTTLNPVLMSLLIGATFAILIISPISSVVIALAIKLSAVNSGIANLGCSATMISVLIGSLFVNKPGVSVTVGLGIVKMLVGNLLKYPILCLPLAVSGALCGLSAYLLGIQGTAFSAGFGYSGLIGPLAAYQAYMTEGILSSSSAIFRLLVGYVLVPLVVCSLVHFVFIKVLKIYTFEIVRFNPLENK
ncbi:PTS sugar transporter subunit IIC [Psittacicella gerlachiana]|uniref:Phosphotransferase system EIIC domain-containing protein n=1 Tax=Psittacicella gerlachiana TaxID=2028574 RepID=A0A3A1YMG9_9GAMM|nr:PTS sugar transporter subunit IIC [Psittacicella gerlachiana]RIY38458.1 hypothetical protein CKF59_00815 [Psittacicella gerlachiana]